jgi:hypothetical protein
MNTEITILALLVLFYGTIAHLATLKMVLLRRKINKLEGIIDKDIDKEYDIKENKNA